MPRSSRPALALAAWTAFVWSTRIRNAVRGDKGAGPIALSAVLLALAAAVVVLALRRDPRLRPSVLALAGLTVAVWLVRSVDIALLSDHGAAFVAVHLALAVVSVALAAWAARRAL